MSCPLCHSQETPVLEGFFIDCLRCRHCGFVFSQGVEDSSDPQLYDEEWAKTEVHPTFWYQNGRFVARNEAFWDGVLRRVQPFRRLNRLLDVGCSAAFFLKMAHDRGWEVQGIEVSDFGVNFSRKELGIDVRQGTLQDAAFQNESFDVVFSSHVLEHISDPRALVHEMIRILRPGGALVSVIPTQYATPSYRFLGDFGGEGPPRHVSFFTKRTFKRLMEEEKLRVIHSRQNIEIQRLLAAIRGRRPKPAKSTNGGQSAGTAMPTVSREGWNPLLRSVKLALNACGTAFGLGDELTTIAVKP